MEISKGNQKIAKEIFKTVLEIAEAVKSKDEKALKNAQDFAASIAEYTIGGYLQLLDMAQQQANSMERIAVAFESIAIDLQNVTKHYVKH